MLLNDIIFCKNFKDLWVIFLGMKNLMKDFLGIILRGCIVVLRIVFKLKCLFVNLFMNVFIVYKFFYLVEFFWISMLNLVLLGIRLGCLCS